MGEVRALGRNRAALESSIQHLATGPQHEALIEHCRSLADLMDLSQRSICPECERFAYDDKVIREYRLALGVLYRATGGDDGDPTPGWLEEIQQS